VNKPSVKRAVIALGITGAATAALFGGSAVSTAFTSSSSGNFHADVARSAIGTSGTVSLGNAAPGDLGPATTVHVGNQGSTPESLSITLTGGNPALNPFIDVFVGGQYVGNLATLESATAGGISLHTTIPVGGPDYTASVALGLNQSADNSVEGMGTDVTYTVTGTATSNGGDTHQD
jgi:hypothetical protein